MAKPRKYKSSKSKFLAPEVLDSTARLALEIVHSKNIQAAVAGGYAMQIYGSPRLTGDVDLISAEAPRDMGVFRLVEPLTFGGRRYVSADGVEVDLIKREDYLKGLYQEALEKAVETEDGIPIVTPEYLAIIKLAAARPKDEDDLVWLLQEPDLVDRGKALEIADRLLGGRFARDSFQSFMDEADWRTEREKRNP